MTHADRCRLRSPSTNLSGLFSEQKRDIFAEGPSLTPRNAETTVHFHIWPRYNVDEWT